MDLEIYQTRSDLYFLLRGRVVLEECDKLKNTCLPLVKKGIEQVIVDLSKVDFIDSAGLGVLVGFKMTSSKNKARIVLLQPSRPVSDILYISKLDGIFDILTGPEAEALKSQTVQPQNKHGAASTPSVQVGSGIGVGFQAVMDKAYDYPSGQGPVSSAVPAAASAGSSSGSSSSWGASASGTKPDSVFPEVTAANYPGDSSELRSQKEIIDEHCRRAVEFMRQGNYEMSVEEYNRALEIDPDYLPALNNLAIVYEKQPSWISKAIEQWEHVLRLSQGKADQKHVDRAQRHLANLRKMS